MEKRETRSNKSRKGSARGPGAALDGVAGEGAAAPHNLPDAEPRIHLRRKAGVLRHLRGQGRQGGGSGGRPVSLSEPLALSATASLSSAERGATKGAGSALDPLPLPRLRPCLTSVTGRSLNPASFRRSAAYSVPHSAMPVGILQGGEREGVAGRAGRGRSARESGWEDMPWPERAGP